ncbi:SDR family NAD(P)-dependent oxidoreductase [Nonomuraea sp. NPDC059007]|uniref:SDR family NAD(P)-dependent oxidoreductase n=1 Tax=Nonomuraea sp. NPDC059007 TaxID=3346692 RepID=UPI0036CA35E3
MELGLSGKAVLVTGGSSALGSTMARTFAEEGARVALTFHRNRAGAEKVVMEIGRRGGEAFTLPLDLAEADSVHAAVRTVEETWGGVDVLVASASPAGGPRPKTVPFEDIPAGQWRAQLRTEVEGAFHLTQAVIPGMKRRHWGRIVLMSARLVDRGMPGEEAYLASKAALHGLGRTLATELIGDHVLVNVVAPGATVTEGLLPRLPPDLRKLVASVSPEEAKRVLNEAHAPKRYSTPQEVANVVVFLASAANGHVTGSVVAVSGGH